MIFGIIFRRKFSSKFLSFGKSISEVGMQQINVGHKSFNLSNDSLLINFANSIRVFVYPQINLNDLFLN